MEYKLVKGARGDRWMKETDGKWRFVAADKVPDRFKQTDKCLICDNPPTHKRSVIGMTVDLCDEHYFNVSYGFIAGILKKEGI